MALHRSTDCMWNTLHKCFHSVASLPDRSAVLSILRSVEQMSGSSIELIVALGWCLMAHRLLMKLEFGLRDVSLADCQRYHHPRTLDGIQVE